jgi:nucleoside-diphosphate-sugar epimerase
VVLVTNATQPVPLQVIKMLLERGCSVRAATMWMEDASWLNIIFSPYRRLGKFEHVTVGPGQPQHKSFYREAIKGVYAVVHSPTLPKSDHIIENYWSLAVDSVVCMLEAADRESSVKAFVYTSSIVAAAPTTSPTDLLVTEDSWNVKDTILALTGQADSDVVRHSGMVRAEQAFWHWTIEQRPSFKYSVVSPANLIGQNYAAEYTTHWRNWIWRLYKFGFAREEIPGAGPTQARRFLLSQSSLSFDPNAVRQIGTSMSKTWRCCTSQPSSTLPSRVLASRHGDVSGTGTTQARLCRSSRLGSRHSLPSATTASRAGSCTPGSPGCPTSS